MNPNMFNPMMTPNMPINPNMPTNQIPNFTPGGQYNNMPSSDLESRLSKMERQIKRLDARISRLENSFNGQTPNNQGYYNELNNGYNQGASML